MNKIPGCETNTIEDTNEWLHPIIEKDNLYTDEDIINLICNSNEDEGPGK